MSPSAVIILPSNAHSAAAAATLASRLRDSGDVIIVGSPAPRVEGVTSLEVQGGRGEILHAGLARAKSEITVILDADPTLASDEWNLESITSPISQDTADVVVGHRAGNGSTLKTQVPQLAHAALSRFARFVADVEVSDPLSSVRAFRTEALKSITFTEEEEGVDAEILVKLAAQRFRFTQVSLPVRRSSARKPIAAARTLLKYAALANDADNLHEGYNTLARMEEAPNYNAWIGRRIRAHLGRRVLEIGAGIGTITRELESACELLIALEVDAFYVDRLKNLFRGKPHVRPYLSDVALADWESLAKERIDTIVLSNVLEHIPDDVGALRRFKQILTPGGKVVLLVPAIQQLYGSIDEAVGHHRRYTPATLRQAFTEAGFEVERLEWMNLLGVPGWFLNNRVLRRRAVPPLQLKIYDAIAPLFAELESHVKLPLGLSLFAVATVR